MTTKTVTWVADDLSAWENNGKTTYYINVAFDDDTVGSLGKQDQGKATELRALLVDLIGKPSEFGLEDTGKKSQKGQPKLKIKSFPGYEPAPYEGGGGGKASWYNSQEGVEFTQERMDRRTALMQAVALRTLEGPGELLANADSFYNWLRATASLPVATGTTGAGTPHIPAPTTSAVSTESAPERKPGSGEGSRAAAGEREWGAAPLGEGGTAPCSHSNVTGYKPDNSTPLPHGFVRCVDCGLIQKDKTP